MRSSSSGVGARFTRPTSWTRTVAALTNDATFAETVRGADLPVLVEFTAEWCMPCKQLAPILDQIAIEHAGKLQIATIDVDENPNSTRLLDVMSMPTLILFKEGTPVRRLVGARGKHVLLEDLADVLE